MSRVQSSPRLRRTTIALIALIGLSLFASTACQPSTDSATTTTTTTTVAGGVQKSTVSVFISGGHETNPADNGRPVSLIASVLGVPESVFREAFSHVTPALNGQPDSALARANKDALLAVLGPYGITNDELDAASNYYRYRAADGETWRQRSATAAATIVDGTVTGIVVTDPGAGYTSAPTVTISGIVDISATATVSFTADTATNGSISAITLN